MLLQPIIAKPPNRLHSNQNHVVPGSTLSDTFSFPSVFLQNSAYRAVASKTHRNTLLITCAWRSPFRRREADKPQKTPESEKPPQSEKTPESEKPPQSEKTPKSEKPPPVVPNWKLTVKKIVLAVRTDPTISAASVLNQEVKEGKKFNKMDLLVMIRLLKEDKFYRPALEVYKWMNERQFDYVIKKSDTLDQVDLILRVHGLTKAIEYYKSLPFGLKGTRMFQPFLKAYCDAGFKRKAEILFGRMRERGLLTTAFPYNRMMELYLKLKDYEKVELLIAEMKEQKLRLNVHSYTYWLLAIMHQPSLEKVESVYQNLLREKKLTIGFIIWGKMADTCLKLGHKKRALFFLRKYERTMKPNIVTLRKMAVMFIKMGLMIRAQIYLKAYEKMIPSRLYHAYHFLIELYGRLRLRKQILGVWVRYKIDFKKKTIPNSGYHVMITALVHLNEIKLAEVIYDEWLSKKKFYSPEIGNLLLCHYVKTGCTEKFEKIFNQMTGDGGKTNPVTWELLAMHHLKSDRISDAVSALKKAKSAKFSKGWKPNPAVVRAILDRTADKQEYTEALLNLLKRVGCLDDGAVYISCVRASTETDMLPRALRQSSILKSVRRPKREREVIYGGKLLPLRDQIKHVKPEAAREYVMEYAKTHPALEKARLSYVQS